MTTGSGASDEGEDADLAHEQAAWFRVGGPVSGIFGVAKGEMARLDVEASNALFQAFEDWSIQLRDVDIDNIDLGGPQP